ncbi:hypothetical protein HPP92_023384 [Vanilla planifolia]|uniref:Uncharacterized protein n=1 Tax=Vanilla planifolia TaxID=51239 RepID=A0A835UE35_VANPL|nr:hypothetical protein HPP92_023384 [Vanilla planifolia]
MEGRTEEKKQSQKQGRLPLVLRYFLSSSFLSLHQRSEIMGTLETPKTRSNSGSSPEFEFWMVRNRSNPTPEQLSADELFINGIILPLDFLSFPRSDPVVETLPDLPSPPLPPPANQPQASILSSSSVASGSRRWKDLFKVSGEKKPEDKIRYKEKEKKKEPRSSGGSSPELNVNLNIWPFSRSRSAGSNALPGCRIRLASSIAGRNVSSEPCSRSSSLGESSKPVAAVSGTGGCRKSASSPGRTGIHLGRTSPVWQFRRSGPGPYNKARKPALPASKATGVGLRVLNLNVNSCIGCRYRNQVSCREDNGNDGVTGGDCSMERNPNNASNFSLRALFSKKVY